MKNKAKFTVGYCVIGFIVIPLIIWWLFGLWEPVLIKADSILNTSMSSSKREYDALVNRISLGEIKTDELSQAKLIAEKRKFSTKSLEKSIERLDNLLIIMENWARQYNEGKAEISRYDALTFLAGIEQKIVIEVEKKSPKDSCMVFWSMPGTKKAIAGVATTVYSPKGHINDYWKPIASLALKVMEVGHDQILIHSIDKEVSQETLAWGIGVEGGLYTTKNISRTVIKAVIF